MKQIMLVAVFLIHAAPLARAEEEQGLSLMERGAQMFLEGVLKEMEPAIDGFSGLAEEMGPPLQKFFDEMGPKLGALMGEIEDWSVYDAPEILPNGDIIIRRKPDELKKSDTPAPQIEL